MKVDQQTFLNPGDYFKIPQTDSRFVLNPEGHVHFWKFNFLISPTVEANHQGKFKTRFRELNGNFSLGNFDLTVGRRLISLGTGYIYTPISVITPDLKISDPEDTERANKGVDLIKLDYSLENFSLSAIVFKKNNWQNYALFAYYGARHFDFYGILYYPDYKKLEYGFAFSFSAGQALELHSEIMFKQKVPYYRHKVYDVDNPEVTFTENPLYLPNERTYVESVVGGNLTLRNGTNIIFEYLHKDWGINRQEWEKLRLHYQYNFSHLEDELSQMNIQADQDLFTQQNQRGLFRDYLFLRFFKSFQKTDISLITYTNLRDWSTTFILRFEYQLSDGIYLYLSPMIFAGKNDSEFKDFWYDNIFQLGIRTNF